MRNRIAQAALILATVLIVLAMAIPARAASVETNGGFETGSGSDADGWTEGTNQVRSSDLAHGSSSYSLKSTATSAATGQVFNHTTNHWYYLSGYIYRESTGGTAGIRLRYGGTVYLSLTIETAGSWQFVSGSWQGPSNGSADLEAYVDSTPGTVYFDDICLSETESDCAQATPTPTSTFTPTSTPTSTATPTATGTSTATPTATPPGNTITWAQGLVTLSDALRLTIGNLLASDPPTGHSGSIYVVTYVSGTDTGWNVSIANLVDVDSPYEVWDAEDNMKWAGIVQCTGTEPTWSCDYYEAPGIGGNGGLVLPWEVGYSATYGVAGVHRDTNSIVSGSYAVDFFGSDNNPSSMPDYAVAAADGTIDWVCNDGTTAAILVSGGPVTLAYFHFTPDSSFTIGQAVRQGEMLGNLQRDNFSDSCGHATQQATAYHVHFVFLPTTAGYLEIGDCVLDLGTENFVCNGNTYGTLSGIPNGGETSGGNVTPVPGDDTGYQSAKGGAHIWDGIVDAIVQFCTNNLADILPDQNENVPYFLTKGYQLFEALGSLFMLLFIGTFSGTILLIVAGMFIACEFILLQFKLMIWLGRVIL